MPKAPVCGWKLEKAARKPAPAHCRRGRGGARADVRAGGGRGSDTGAALPGRKGLNDSKKLSEKKRNELDVEIRASAVAWAIAAVDVETIDRINIRKASLLAMKQAVSQLALTPDYLLIDGIDTIDFACPQQAIIQGDGTSFSIAAASVLAKVYRDRLLVELDAQFPGYGLASHKGYCCPAHLAALARLGPTPLHRRNWSPVAQTMLQFPEMMETAEA